MIQVSLECEAVIKQLAPLHHKAADAPNNYTKLVAWLDDNELNTDSLPVYDGNCDNTIFSSEEANVAFRAWHDAIHLENKLSFTKEDELKVADIHVRELRAMGVSEDDIDLIFADVAGQVLYYYHSKNFIDNQQNFHVALAKDCDITNYRN